MKNYVVGEGMVYSWIIFDELPDLNFFQVGINGKNHVFATLDNSVGFYGIQPFCPDHDVNFIDFIDGYNKSRQGHRWYILRTFSSSGICFAETGMCYKFVDREDFKRDYFIAKLAGISTRRF